MTLDCLPVDILAMIIMWLPEYAVFMLAGVNKHMFCTLYELCRGKLDMTPWVRIVLKQGWMDLFKEMEPELTRYQIEKAVGKNNVHLNVKADTMQEFEWGECDFDEYTPNPSESLEYAILSCDARVIDKILRADPQPHNSEDIMYLISSYCQFEYGPQIDSRIRERDYFGLNKYDKSKSKDEYNVRFVLDAILRCPACVPDATILIVACFYGLDTIVTRVLKLFPNINIADDDSYVLRIASYFGYRKIIKTLLNDLRVDPSAFFNNVLLETVRQGDADIVKILLANPRLDITSEFCQNRALEIAARFGHTNIVKILLEDGRFDPLSYRNEPMCFAAKHGHIDIVKLLLDDGRADPRHSWHRVFMKARENNHKEIIDLIRADPRCANLPDDGIYNWNL